MPYKDKDSKEAKESHIKRSAKYYEINREVILQKNKTDENRLKSGRINNWKRRGVIGDFNYLYSLYINATNCSTCNISFNDTKNKCLDHDHDTGEYRNIICRKCNNWDNWKKI